MLTDDDFDNLLSLIVAATVLLSIALAGLLG